MSKIANLESAFENWRRLKNERMCKVYENSWKEVQNKRMYL